MKAKTAILALGAKWRSINVPGEDDFKNKGVTYCPHCDGPLFEDKNVAVIGGGNSGLEAALDLAGLAKHVYVLEFLPELKADKVLQDRAAKTDNMTILKMLLQRILLGTIMSQGLTISSVTAIKKSILTLKESLYRLAWYQIQLGSKTAVSA